MLAYRKKRLLQFKFGDFTLEYIPNKCLKIRKNNHSVIFYDIAQYYNGKSLTETYKKNIGKIKEVVKQVNLNADRKRLWLGKIESIDSKVMNDSMPLSLNYFMKNEI